MFFSSHLIWTVLLCNVIAGRIVNSIFRKWGISASSNWNISGELCSGAAIDTVTTFADGSFNPAIKCACGNTTCRITQLYVISSKTLINSWFCYAQRALQLFDIWSKIVSGVGSMVMVLAIVYFSIRWINRRLRVF